MKLRYFFYFFIFFSGLLFSYESFMAKELLNIYKKESIKYPEYNKDTYLEKALNYIKDKNLYIKKVIKNKAPELATSNIIYQPNFKKVLYYLGKSIEKKNNLISSILYLSIIDDYYLTVSPQSYILRRKAAKIACDAGKCNICLEYSRFLIDGVGGYSSKLKALDVLEKYYDKCKKNIKYTMFFNSLKGENH